MVVEITIDWDFFAAQFAQDQKSLDALAKFTPELEASLSVESQDRSLLVLHYGDTLIDGAQARVGTLEDATREFETSPDATSDLGSWIRPTIDHVPGFETAAVSTLR